MSVTTTEVLTERGSRYGNYLEQTKISHAIKEAMAGMWESNMQPDQLDCLEMIAVKLSRIINGDPDYGDNWRDIAGYATLVADRLENKATEYK